MTKTIIISFTLISLLFSLLACADTREKTLDTLLGSDNVAEQRAAFKKISSSPEKYVPMVRNRLESIVNGQIEPPMRSIDRLFYLAAILKDKSLAPPMEALWHNTDALPYYCLYSCPIVFALTIYATSDLWTPPDNMDKVLDRHNDLYSQIRRASGISLDPTPQEHRARGPGIDKFLQEAATQTEEELLELAGPYTKVLQKRFAAAEQLSYSVSSSKNLNTLYWLAIQEMHDASYEFRNAIYEAIYRAEKAHRMGR